MANTKKAPLTDEEAAEMQQRLMEYNSSKAQEQQEAFRAAAGPIIDFLSLPALKEIEGTLPAVEQIAQDRETFGDLGVHLTAVRTGLTGLRFYAEQMQKFAASAPEPGPA